MFNMYWSNKFPHLIMFVNQENYRFSFINTWNAYEFQLAIDNNFKEKYAPLIVSILQQMCSFDNENKIKTLLKSLNTPAFYYSSEIFFNSDLSTPDACAWGVNEKTQVILSLINPTIFNLDKAYIDIF